MGSNPPQANASPPKPWERAGSSSGPAPFRPPSSGNTSDVVEASGTAKPGEVVNTANRNTAANVNTVGRPLPSRPWEQQNYGNSNTYGGYGSNLNYNSGYGSSMYNTTAGGYGGSYGGGLYGNTSMYRGGIGGGYGGGMYGGSGIGGSGMYGGGMYNSGGGLGGPMGGYGMGMGGPYGNQDPNDPYGPPSSPPGFWMSFLRVMHGVVNFFGRISVLIDQNTQAFHLFMSAMLQLFDRSGMLYGELARFVLRIFGIKSKPRKLQPGEMPGFNGVQGPNGQGGQQFLEGPKAPSGSWDNVWGDNGVNGSS